MEKVSGTKSVFFFRFYILCGNLLCENNKENS